MARFKQNQASVKHRGIGWALTFDEWWDIWKDRYHLRGKKKEEMQLCRYMDVGNYAAANVRIDTCSNNHHEAGPAFRLRAIHVNRATLMRGAGASMEYQEISQSLKDPLKILIEREEEEYE